MTSPSGDVDAAKGTPVYEKRAVAFLDILGFSNVIITRGAELEILDVFEGLKLRAQQVERVSLAGSMKLSAFSDSIVVSEELLDGAGADRIAGYAGYLALDLLAKGFLVRGGLAVGDLYHRGGTVFGPALIEAYHLESKVAIFPRLAVSTEFRSSVTANMGAPRFGLNPVFDAWRVASLFRTDFDGIAHVDIFGPFIPHPMAYLEGSGLYRAPTPGGPGIEVTKEINAAAARNAVAFARRLRFSPAAQQKYDWMDRYLADASARNGW